MKCICLVNIFVWFLLLANAQGKFDLRIIVETKSSKLTTSLYFERDTSTMGIFSLVNGRQYTFRGRTLNGYGVFTILMKYGSQTESRGTYFATSGEGILRLKWDSLHNSIVIIERSRNIIPAYDTTGNSIFKEMVVWRHSAVRELVNVLDKPEYTKDQLGIAFKNVNEKTLEYLGKVENGYLSFWYFEKEVFNPASAYLENDTAYLRRLSDKLATSYRRKFGSLNSYRRMAGYFDIVLSEKLKVGDIAPEFERINKVLKSKGVYQSEKSFLILDFWASWCGPCLAQVPATRELIRRLREEKIEIEIIGISLDKDEMVMGEAAKKYGMEWVNILDQDGKYKSAFKVLSIPFLVLISEKGTIMYISDGRNEIEMIERYFLK